MDKKELLNNAIGLYEQIDVPIIIINNQFELEWLSECAGRVYPQYKLKNGFASALSESRLQTAKHLLGQNKIYSFSMEHISNSRFNCTMTPLMLEGMLLYILVQLSQAPELPSGDDEDVSRFIATFSKHVREPLFYIFSALATISHRFETAEDYSSLEYVKAIQKNAYSILRTVAHLSDHMKDVNGIPSHNPSPIPFSMYIRDLYTTVESVTRSTGIPVYLDMEESPDSNLVMVDETRLSEAILNVLLNSFLYTREGNQIVISLRYVSNSAVLTITDAGSGINQEHLGSVFSPNFSYDMGNAPLRNVGLGLTLARNTIQRHNGVMTINSKEHEGTSVTIRLPIARTQAMPELFQAPPMLNLRNRFSPVYIELAEISNVQIL